MNKETLEKSIRKFLKQVGISSQIEIEKAVQAAIDSGRLGGNERCRATMRLEVADLDLVHELEGVIALE